jgi:hypothetical protein
VVRFASSAKNKEEPQERGNYFSVALVSGAKTYSRIFTKGIPAGEIRATFETWQNSKSPEKT